MALSMVFKGEIVCLFYSIIYFILFLIKEHVLVKSCSVLFKYTMFICLCPRNCSCFGLKLVLTKGTVNLRISVCFCFFLCIWQDYDFMFWLPHHIRLDHVFCVHVWHLSWEILLIVFDRALFCSLLLLSWFVKYVQIPTIWCSLFSSVISAPWLCHTVSRNIVCHYRLLWVGKKTKWHWGIIVIVIVLFVQRLVSNRFNSILLI